MNHDCGTNFHVFKLSGQLLKRPPHFSCGLFPSATHAAGEEPPTMSGNGTAPWNGSADNASAVNFSERRRPPRRRPCARGREAIADTLSRKVVGWRPSLVGVEAITITIASILVEIERSFLVQRQGHRVFREMVSQQGHQV